MTDENITGDCKTCKPCGDCKGEGPLPDWAEPGMSLCDFCNPCSSTQTCSYCGNGFCRCDLIVETDEGIMHKDCEEIYSKHIEEIQKKAKHICLITRGVNLEFENLGSEVNEASESLSIEDLQKTQKSISRIALQLNRFCELLPEGKKEPVCDVVEEIRQAIKFPDKLEKIELALSYVSSAVELSLQEKTNENELIFGYLKNIELGVSTLKLNSGSARQDLLKLQADINKLRSQIESHGLSLVELDTNIRERDHAIAEKLEKMRTIWLLTVENMAQGLPRCTDTDRILSEVQGLKQSTRRDIIGISGDISSLAGLFIGLISLACS